MKFILIADEDGFKKETSFFPLWEVCLFVAIVIGLLYVLYPSELEQKVLAQEKPSAVTLSYLQAFSKTNQQNPPFLFTLIEQEIGMGQLVKAQANIILLKKMMTTSHAGSDTQLNWLTYLILRKTTDQTKMNTANRIDHLHKLRDMGEFLASKPLKSKQLKILASDSLALGKANIALNIYHDLLKNKALTTPDELADGGSIAMQNNAHRESAAFYWAASQASTGTRDRKKYALLAIKVLWAGNRVQEALALTKQLPASLIKDRTTLIYLSHLALAANHPEIAEYYAIEALLVPSDAPHE